MKYIITIVKTLEIEANGYKEAKEKALKDKNSNKTIEAEIVSIGIEDSFSENGQNRTGISQFSKCDN